jgi:GAF domain-containing protein
MKTDESVYKSIIPVLKSLSEEKLPASSILANTAALLYSSFEKISWAGFYLLEGETLYLGPFQGKAACTKIDINRGVCGKAARNKKTVIVEDVDLFPGHIACDSESKSEIVVPVILDDSLIGVLDIDSPSYSSFDSKDQIYLEEITSIIVKNSSFPGFKIL